MIRKEIGDKEGEATDYGNLGTVFQSVGQYTKAEECLQKALLIQKVIGDRKGEASTYGPTYPFPNPSFCTKWEVSVYVRLGEE